MNCIHSYDGYVLRELCRRCNYDPIALGRAIRSLESPKVGKACKAKAKKLKHLESLYREFKQVSVVAIEYITKETAACVSEEYRQELLNILYIMEEVKPFGVKTIHDDFRCLPAYVNQMKLHYNYLLKEAYESEWIVSVIGKFKKTKINAQGFNPVVSNDILSNNYSIS